MAYRQREMTPGAEPPARERSASRVRVSGALGVSVVLHVLGAGALWWGTSEPERLEPDKPLEVELVWREAAAPSTGSPPPVRGSESSVRPVSPPRPRKTGTPRPEVSEPAPSLALTPPEPDGAARQGETGSEEPPGAVVPEEPTRGVSGTGPDEVGSSAGAGGASAGAGASEAGAARGSGAGGDSELVLYRERLRQRVTERLRYPAQAVRLGLVGTALVRVRINRDGSLAVPPRLEGSSRFRVLDVEALRVVEASAPFSPLPAEVHRDAVEFVIPVSFSLRSVPG